MGRTRGGWSSKLSRISAGGQKKGALCIYGNNTETMQSQTALLQFQITVSGKSLDLPCVSLTTNLRSSAAEQSHYHISMSLSTFLTSSACCVGVGAAGRPRRGAGPARVVLPQHVVKLSRAK